MGLLFSKICFGKVENSMKKCRCKPVKTLKKIYIGIPRIKSLFITFLALIMSIVGFLQFFWSFDLILALHWPYKVFIILGFLLVVLVFSTISYFIIFKCKTLYDCKDCKISSMYGDLFEIAFPKREKDNSEREIFVIPVNTTFDVIIDKDPAIENPLVSSDTNHGRWIEHMVDINNEQDVNNLNNEIQTFLNNKKGLKFKTIDNDLKPRGNLNEYPIGTIAIVNKGHSTFYLVALSSFDNKNHAQSDAQKVVCCLDAILEQYESGQKYDLYMPLMGSGLSRAGLSDVDSYTLIKNYLCSQGFFIHGQINIVVYKGNSDKIPL